MNIRAELILVDEVCKVRPCVYPPTPTDLALTRASREQALRSWFIKRVPLRLPR